RLACRKTSESLSDRLSCEERNDLVRWGGAMARFKPYDYHQLKLVPVSFERQILPGTFEATLSRLIDEEIDLSVFEARYRNDEVGGPAYDPAILLKVILYAYARGVTSSREIARLCRENVVFM